MMGNGAWWRAGWHGPSDEAQARHGRRAAWCLCSSGSWTAEPAAQDVGYSVENTSKRRVGEWLGSFLLILVKREKKKMNFRKRNR